MVAKEANDANDILAFINKDELELVDDGTVKGLDEAVETLKESSLIYLRRLSLQVIARNKATTLQGNQQKKISKDDLHRTSRVIK